MRIVTLLLALTLLSGRVSAAEPLRAAANAPRPDFNRLHDYDEMVGYLKGWSAAYPKWVSLQSIGKSIQGRDIWLLTITNPATGEASSKPAMYIDGNTHANEVQGGEAALYVVDFALRNYGRSERVTELLDRATLYVVPMVNPDGRAMWFRGPSTPHFPRTVMISIDDDRDGRSEEDGFDDLNGDGVITQMRKRVAMGEGTHRLDPKDPRILRPVEKEELGDYVILGYEGSDNDGDGRVNEDTIGYVDPNRTWGWGWQSMDVQPGAGRYPFSASETRSIATWALGTPNIGAVQSFHNYGKMILRGPGAKSHPAFPAEDVKAHDLIGLEGEKLLPGYKYMVTWRDLYTTHGSTTDYFYRVHGALAFTNELYDPPADLDKNGTVTPEEEMRFNDLLTAGRQFVAWKSVKHPQYGEVEVGGFRQDVGRVPESWLLEEDMHRNALFVLFNAHHLPKLTLGAPRVESAGADVYRVIVPVTNERAIPSMLGIARQNKLHRSDIVTVEGAKVLASGIVQNEWLDQVELQRDRPERLEVSGVDGLSTRKLFFLVQGSGTATIRYDSLKGGVVTRQFQLR
jgi:hypothetical protein